MTADGQSQYYMTYTLSNARRVDCMLFLPEPTGKVPIDSKFPLENYRRKVDPDTAEDARKAAESQYSQRRKKGDASQ